MISVKEFDRLKTKVDLVKREVSRAEGALQEQLKIMKRDYGCETLEEAKEKLASITKKLKKAEKRYSTDLQAFQEEWGEVLGL